MPRVPGTGQHAAQVTGAETGVRAVPGDAARFVVAVGDQHAARAEPAQLHRGGQPGGPRPDDEDVRLHAGSAAAGRTAGAATACPGPAPANSAATVAAQ